MPREHVYGNSTLELLTTDTEGEKKVDCVY